MPAAPPAGEGLRLPLRLPTVLGDGEQVEGERVEGERLRRRRTSPRPLLLLSRLCLPGAADAAGALAQASRRASFAASLRSSRSAWH